MTGSVIAGVAPLAASGSAIDVQWWGIIPFVLMLLSIAIFPLIPKTAHLWEHPRNQVVLALVLGVPVALWFVLGGDTTRIIHALVEYVQFIALLLSLFVVAGGIFLRGDLAAHPRTNTIFLGIGAVVASFIGTTGAAMLLIRPILKTNAQRRHKAHTVIFTILIVANCGGLLTPLGDPPLFLGFLRGVPFLWTMNLLPEWFFVNACLLIMYFLLDRKAYARERPEDIRRDETEVEKLGIDGKLNFLWFGCVILGVALVPSLDLHAIETGQAGFADYVPWREIVMIGAAAASYVTTSKEVRFGRNEFNWAPIQEVAALFIGIFLTMVPALVYLEKVAPSLPLNKVSFFVFSGSLSAVLDNAPTYVTFFEMARASAAGNPDYADATLVAGVPEIYLVSISLGAVFCGAVTYIGNGPNFMVKAVAEKSGLAMPSFGGYLVWTFRYLVPVLVGMVMIFIVREPLWIGLGLAVTVATNVKWGVGGGGRTVKKPAAVDA